MTAYALDYSAGRPTAAQVLAAGYVGVIRYIGYPGNRKCLTIAEYADMTGHGVPVSLVHEQNAGDALLGRAAGGNAATLARTHANAIGYPASRPIYYACDTDVVTEAQFLAVLDYLRGAGAADGGPALVGVYGEFDVVERAAAAGVATWFWQTRAWSGGSVSGRAHLRQEIGTFVVGGVACDRNTILQADWGQTGQAGDPPMSAAELTTLRADIVDLKTTVTAVGDTLYNLTRAQDRTGKPDPGHAEQAVTVANGRLTTMQVAVAQVAAALAAIGRQVGALSDDEAKILGAIGAAEAADQAQFAAALTAGGATEAKLLAAIDAVPQSPGGGVDAQAVVVAFRDALARGTA